MKKLRIHLIFLFMLLVIYAHKTSSQVLDASKLWIRVYGGCTSYLLTFGNRMGNSTTGIDSAKSFPMEYREVESPPPPFCFEAIWAPVRTNQFGPSVRGLMHHQFNARESANQVDTFKIYFSDEPEKNVSFRWISGADLLLRCDSAAVAYLDTVVGNVRINMATTDTLALPQAGTRGIHYLNIFKYGAHLVESSTEREKLLPHDFYLDQNYPNPFNPETRIQYAVSSRQYVSLKIFDVLGREVATLVDEMKEPGEHDVDWDASGITSGIYFYRLQAGGFVGTKKMILLR
ncbi:MAG TPA: T9SS type A sorting domain-containing protein [Bacteroidota bacterium]|nr:T9SS type A sorting domain-containing protein [Bacteroidota bacterium]